MRRGRRQQPAGVVSTNPARTFTKIIATVGPATQNPESLAALITAGVDVLRLNFSHGAHGDHAAVIAAARRIADDSGRTIALLQDLQGPKLRVWDLVDGGPVRLDPGATIRIASVEAMPAPGTAARIATTYPHLAEDLHVGDRILLDDGAMELQVEALDLPETGPGDVICRVLHGGLLRERKGINLPGATLRIAALTAKDEADLAFGIAHGVDLIALSFVRSAQDLRHAKSVIRRLGGRQPLIAKIEKPQAVDNLEAIVRVGDGIMVARGDLGVEMSPEAVPAIQKHAIHLANRHGVPVITATQMLESMMTNPRPTRAEASDVANAILDGSDAVMLSGETAIGQYPVAAVEVMSRIARETERSSARDPGPNRSHRAEFDLAPAAARSDAHAIARAAKALARALPAQLILVLTATGRTAGIVSSERPGVPIVALTTSPAVARRLGVWFGVNPVVTDVNVGAEPHTHLNEILLSNRLAVPGDCLVIVRSNPRFPRGRDVSLLVHRIPIG